MFVVFVLLIFVVSTVYTDVTIDFQPKIIRLNDTINLTCTVDDKESFEYNRQWRKEHDLICLNGYSIDHDKYKEIQTSENQFTLQIRNVSASDVNSMYQCRFGFKESSTTTSTLKDHFEYPPLNEVRAIVQTNASDGFLTIYLHFKKIFPLPKCTTIIEGSSLSFNIISSKTVVNYFNVNLRYRSTDILNCNEDVVVKCKLREEFFIPIEDHRKCPVKDNPPNQLKVFLSICVFLLLIILLCTIYRRKTRIYEWYRTKCCKKGPTRVDDSKPLIKTILTCASLNSDASLDQTYINKGKDLLEERDQKGDEDNIKFSLQPEKQENVSGDGQLKRGDAISFRRKVGPFKYEHYGIVEKIIPGTTRFRIIHITGTSKDVVSSISSNTTTGICSEVVDFESDTDIYKYTFMCGRQDGKNPAAVAEMFLDYGFPDELGFHILHFNCESFCRYCATGVVYSKQTGQLNEAAQAKLDALVGKIC